MADSVYTADLFGSPADDVPEPVLAASNCHFLNLDSALASVPESAPHPLLPPPKWPSLTTSQSNSAPRLLGRPTGALARAPADGVIPFGRPNSLMDNLVGSFGVDIWPKV
jgi:hypothetical protein